MAVLDAVPVEKIGERAREINVGRTILALLALPFFLLGWIVRKTALAFVWIGVAFKAGWIQAGNPQAFADESG